MTQTMTDNAIDFLTELARQEAAKTVHSHGSDLTRFGWWSA